VGVLSEIDVIKRLAPLSMAAYIDDPRLQLAGAKRYSLQMEKNPSPCRVIGAWPQPVAAKRPQKVRVGYLSSDFSNHAVGYLMSDVFENHDRSKFEITVFNIGPRNDDALQTKIIGQVDRWFDLTGLPDRTAAALIVREGCDILIDMNGHTNHQRTGVLALKPAPVIVNWLGYPGTMGSSYHHYILADDFIVTPDLEPFYSETVLRLPCYQPNGRLYEVQQSPELRADLGLPETGVVFCCFNGSVKITEPVFSRWMTILASVPGSVIWMRGKSGDDHARRMQAEAVRRGIAPERLVFLSFRSNTEYLGCHRYADLFLDSFPYGAHTTASDALRMGMPIVTLAGHSFASRVCGSLSIAAGLPELVCESREQYVALAIALGNDPAKLAQVKARLKASLPTCVLFDARRLVTSLEELFEQMWGAYATGSLRQPCIDVIDIDRVTPILGNGISPDVVSRADYLRRIRLED
jgi:predicted O-linked N-acetylglucosamine transferase (SPINDLY family)